MPTQGKPITGFPTTQAQMAEWQKKYKAPTKVGDPWREKITVQSDLPGATKTFLDIEQKAIGLQKTAVERFKVTPTIPTAPVPPPTAPQIDLSGTANVSTVNGKQFIRGTPIQPTGDGGYIFAGKIIPPNVFVPDFRKIHLPSGKNVLEAPVLAANFKGVQGLNLVGFGGGANYFIAESRDVLPPITKNSSGVDVYVFPNGQTVGAANVVIKNYTGGAKPIQTVPTNVIEKEIRDTGKTTAIQTDVEGNVIQSPEGPAAPEPIAPGLEDFEFEEEPAIMDTEDERDADVQAEQEQAEEEQKEAEETQIQADKEDAEIKSLERQKRKKELEIELGLEEEAPEAPELLDTYTTLRSEKGIGAIEEQLNVLDKTIRDTQESLRQGLYDVEGELKPMKLIGTKQRELARKGQEQLDTLNRQKQTLVDEYNTKLGLINSIMGYTQQDFSNAQTEYQTKFGNALKLMDIIMEEEEIERTEEQEERDIEREEKKESEKMAQANWNVLLGTVGDALKSGAVTSYAELPEDQQMMLRKLELQGGLPEGMTEAVLGMIKPEKNIKSVLYSTDKATVSFIYDDKTTETFKTGLTAKVIQPTAIEREQEEITNAQNLLTNFGQRDYVSGGYYEQVRANSTLSPTEFDKRFGHLLSDADRQKLGMTKVDELAQWEEKKVINQWLSDTEGGLNLDPDAQKSQIRIWGYNPEDFSIY